MLAKGMILTPELRGNGIFLSLPITENVSDLHLNRLVTSKLGAINFKECRALTEKVLQENHVKYKNQDQFISELSGGNMQKVILGRSLELDNLNLIIFDEPTTGMDIGAKYEVYHHLRALAAERKVGIVVISSELDELFSICDRLYVFAEGNITHHVKRRDFNKQEVLDAALRTKNAV